MPHTPHFADRLIQAVQQKRTPVLVGLDPRVDQLPASLRPRNSQNWEEVADSYYQFCCRVVDVVAPIVPAVKPQAAFFEELGPAGMVALGRVIAYARNKGVLVIIDGKRNDIGSTAEAYARGFLGPLSPWGGDALTVSPYLGDDSLTPFCTVAHEAGAGLFVLVKTSNPGGKIFQDLDVSGQPLYNHVADLVDRLAKESRGSSGYGFVGAVVGATYPDQLVHLRRRMTHTWFLVPGFGTQGGTAKDVGPAFDDRGLGAIVNNSRGIIFAHRLPAYRDSFGESRWEEAVEQSTRDMIAQLRAETAAGQL